MLDRMCDRYPEGRGLVIFRLISLVDFISRTLEILKAFHGPLQPMPRKGSHVRAKQNALNQSALNGFPVQTSLA